MHGWRRLALLAAVPLLATAAAKAPEPSGGWGIGFDDYPPEALRARLQGTTRYEIAVDEAGRAQTCTTIKSSGHTILDARTCSVLMRRAKFKPARDDAGIPVPGTWRHLVAWRPVNVPDRVDRPGFVGYGLTVGFDGDGRVTGCKVAPLSAISQLNAEQSDKCRSMGTAAVFTELLDQPTKSLANATFRVRTEARRIGYTLPVNEAVHRVLAHVVIDRTDDGGISWCEVKVAPVTPLLGLAGIDLCGPQAYGVTRPGGGGHAENLIFDVVAAR